MQQEYRKEVIQLNRALVEEREQVEESEAESITQRWMERAGERIGDFLAEPSAGQIIFLVAALAIVITAALAYALS
jgi:hypothetical protein